MGVSARAIRRGAGRRAALAAALLATAALLLALAAAPARAQVPVYRVNCGGPALAPLDAGPSWSADLNVPNASPYVNAAAMGDEIFGSEDPMGPPHPSVPSHVPPAIFDEERWDPETAPEMRWEFPVANGSYRVRLYVADGWQGTHGPGLRVWDLACEGALRLDDVDLFATFGAFTPGMLTFDTVVGDGSLSLEFLHGVENTNVRGIEILALPAAGVLAPSTTSLDFGSVLVGGTSPAVQVTVTNGGVPGDPSVTISGASIGGPFAHTLTPQVLAPGQSRAFNVTFAPAAPGAAAGTLTIAHDGVNPDIEIALAGTGVTNIPVGFGKSTLAGTALTHPTSLQFGPDGRLYVAQQDGLIRVHGVARTGANQYAVTATEVITLVQEIPNHGDAGDPQPGIDTRLVTGLLVAGTAANPVLYVSSSDPRMNVAGDIGLDTNSGVISRLTWNGSAWVKRDLVRGLPRSENDHATNGLALDPATNTLYVAQGGNTNMGAPSNNFSFLPEYALAAAILSVDLDAIGETTYDLPTLNDEDRPGVNDLNDPFGGNDGRNQARIVPGGPVQVHSPGWRNPYDVVWTTSGRLYAVDNGPNSGWGGPPAGEGPGGACTNANNDFGSESYEDNLHRVTPGFYAGHPNPTRARTANTFNGSNPQSPVPAGNPVECDYVEPGADGALALWPFSTNGLAEYRASNFGGALQGDLLAAAFDNSVQRIELNGAGDAALSVSALFSSVGAVPLDVTTQGDADTLPGTIWVADYTTNQIVVFEPADYDGGGAACSGADEPGLDEDGDGFSNADEIDNGTSPCSAGDVPADFDGDFLSDRNDPDDDNDGLSDVVDRFALDAANGAAAVPLHYSWDGGDPGTGILGLGFTGLMADDATDYLDRFDPALMTAGGAAGKLTVDAVPAGDARGSLNGQRYALQFGIASDAATGTLQVRTRVSSPYFGGAAPSGAQSLGLFVGDGGDDDYLKLVVTGDAGAPALELLHEVAGVVVDSALVPVPDLLSGTGVDLAIELDPVAATARARFGQFGGAAQSAGAPIALVPGSPLHAAVTGAPPLAVGILATSRDASPFTATWDFFEVATGTPLDAAPGRGLPAALRLLAPFPNPTTGAATLRFELPRPARVSLALYDLAGARVRVLEDGERAAGVHAVRWDGRDAAGRAVPAGIYFQRLEAGGERRTRRIAVLR